LAIEDNHRSPVRALLQTWWGKVLAVLAAVGVAVSAVNGVADLMDRIEGSDNPSDISAGIDLLGAGILGDGFVSYNRFDDIVGLAGGSIVVNNRPDPILLVGIELRFRGKKYDVRYVTPMNCTGGPVTLYPSQPVPIDFFIEGIRVPDIVALSRHNADARFDLIDSLGQRLTVKRVIDRRAIDRGYGLDLIELEQECRGQFP
jgi:hypothetical protein